jgi:NADH-quinone oxidoreductase subunit G
MTATATPPAAGGPPPAELITLSIDDVEVSVPKGTLVIRAAELIGVEIPRFCDHPLLAPAGACRQCLVEVATPGPDGTPRAMPKPQASCTLEATAGMVVRTQLTSSVAEKAQRGVMELLLVNHPLDCPVCDKGGECPLQNQAMANGQATSRFTEAKRTFPKPIRLSTQVLLDRERCVLCQRCTRFSQEIAGDPFIDLQMRGARQQIGTFSPEVLGFHESVEDSSVDGGDSGDSGDSGDGGDGGQPVPATAGDSLLDEAGQPFASYFSGNTVQICPVGALTGAAYRFRARPFDLVSAPSVCEHCASGCAQRTDHRHGTVLRRLAGDDPVVNEEWNCDKGRWAFTWQTAADRLSVPLVRDPATGELEPASWPYALEVAAAGLRRAVAAGGVGVLPGGRLTVEDAYAYAKYARLVLGTHDVDFRARPGSAEEEAFLASTVAGRGIGLTYADLEAAPAVLLAGLEPQEESPIVFLRLRKAVTGRGQAVFSLAPFAGRGLDKLSGRLLVAAPGTEAEVLAALTSTAEFLGAAEYTDVARALRTPGAVVLVGERLSQTPGALSAALRLAEATGARLAWVPRRAGERGAVEAGLLPGLLPGGRPADDAEARVDLAAVWGVPSLPALPGRDLPAILDAAATGRLGGLLVGGVDPADLPDPRLAARALAAAFVVSLEVRASAVTRYADVVLPVAPPAEKAGSYLDWEGRWRSFPAALSSNAQSDLRVLDSLAREAGVELGLRGVERARAELAELSGWQGRRVAAPALAPVPPPVPGPGQAVLATWSLLLDSGRLQDGEPYLAGTAHRAVARCSAATAAAAGLTPGGWVSVATDRGCLHVPLALDDLPDGVVWLPTNSAGCAVRATLGAGSGALVSLTPAAAPRPAAVGSGTVASSDPGVGA